MTVSKAISSARQRPVTQGRRSNAAAQQIKEQRRRYATTILRSLARTQKGRPISQVQQVLRDALRPLGVRLTPTALHELAVNISTGQPVELP